MKKLIIMLGLAGMVHVSAIAQNNPVTQPNNSNSNSSNSGTGLNNNTNTNTNTQSNPSNINTNYDHSPNYYQIPYSDPHTHYLQIDDNPAPVNNNNNNNTMTPYNNTTSPYDITSPYYTPPKSDAPLNNTPPER